MNGYIHIPFCRNKCGYCVFYSESAPEPETIDRFLDSLERDVYSYGESCETVYIGGGTPTLLDESQLKRLAAMVKHLAAPGAEISIESNPETLTGKKAELLRSFVNRLSLGVQSFDPGFRKLLGRDCSQTALEQALELVAEARFPHWNCDLIYGIPGQSMADFQRDLERAALLETDHLSCYSLTPEEGARLSDLKVDDETAAAMWREAGHLLAAAGFRRYEISNYARPGGECRHNRNVWQGGLLKPFGPSAAGFDGNIRMTNPASLAGGPPEPDEIPLPRRLNEIFAVNLRTTDGWTPAQWSRVPHADSWQHRLTLSLSIAKSCPGWFHITPEQITLTEEGLLFWDGVAEQLL